MMNLEKMKQKKSKNSVKKGLLAATTFLCLTTPLLQTQTAYAAENTTPAITIEITGWLETGRNNHCCYGRCQPYAGRFLDSKN